MYPKPHLLYAHKMSVFWLRAEFVLQSCVHWVNYSNSTDAQSSSWPHDSQSKHSISSSGDDVNRDVSSVAKWAWLALSGACALCSMLSKEHGVTSLAVCAVYDVFVHSRLPIAFRTLTRVFKVRTCIRLYTLQILMKARFIGLPTLFFWG